MRLKFLILSFIFLFFLSFTKSINGQETPDYKTDFQVEYFLNDKGTTVDSKVKFNIKITHLRSDIFVKKFSLLFPKGFSVKNINASDDNGQIAPQVSIDNKDIKIELEFTDPKIGKGTENNFYLEFNQDNLFQVNGNIWEVILPTIANKKDSTYKVIVNLPQDTNKKISIAKPKPDLIRNSQIIWDNVGNRTIYAAFGDRQFYQAEIKYHLKNTKIIPVYTYIALPPDTLNQKIYIDSLDPKPDSVMLDTDNNYLAKYILKPSEQKIINLQETFEIFSQPRTEIQAYEEKQFKNQEKYLLTQTKYWQLDNLDKVKDLSNPKDIFNFVSSYLKYDYNKLQKKAERLGAQKSLLNPNNAVCMEFTDLFIAIAREKGIPAREIEGYGFSQDSNFRPLSLISDILHSWPEYYDRKLSLWVPVDPTWESTSGIDYFNSFDFNHVVFAIHGKEPDYPPPAGTYKIEDSKDISIKAVISAPADKINLSIIKDNINKSINDKDTYKGTAAISNNSNIFLRNIPVDFSSDGLLIKPPSVNIDVLAPFQTKDINISYQSKYKNKNQKTELSISAFSRVLTEKNIAVIPYFYQIGLRIIYTVLIFLILVIFIKKLLKR